MEQPPPLYIYGIALSMRDMHSIRFGNYIIGYEVIDDFITYFEYFKAWREEKDAGN